MMGEGSVGSRLHLDPKDWDLVEVQVLELADVQGLRNALMGSSLQLGPKG